MNYAPHVVRKVWTRAQELGYGHRFLNNQTPRLLRPCEILQSRVERLVVVGREANVQGTYTIGFQQGKW